MIKKIKLAIMASLMAMVVGTSVQAAWPLGTDFDKQVNVLQRVQVTPNTLKVIIVFNGGYMQENGLDAGVWDTEANIGLFVKGDEGVIVYYWAGLTAYNPTIAYNDGHTLAGSGTITRNDRLDIPIPVVSRDIEIRTPPNTTKPLYLMLYVQVDPENIGRIRKLEAYGFAGTRKVHAYNLDGIGGSMWWLPLPTPSYDGPVRIE